MLMRIFKLCLCSLLAASILTAPNISEQVFGDETGIYGDVDANKSISMRDALKVLLYAAKALSEEYKAQHINVPCIDLFNITFDHYYKLTKEVALGLYHSVDENNEPDSTHYNEAGARWVSKIIVRELEKLDMDIVKYANQEKLAEPEPTIPPTEEVTE